MAYDAPAEPSHAPLPHDFYYELVDGVPVMSRA